MKEGISMAKDFIVETSARHIHLTEADFKTLFGDDATLTIKKNVITTWTICLCRKSYSSWS